MILGDYTIRWRHVDRVATFCHLMSGDTILAEGFTALGNNDNFCRATGRKISLARAIVGLSRGERTAIWNDYRDMGGKKRW